MRKRAGFIAAAFAALVLNHADAASYYVSAAGSDSNSGLSAEEPFKTPAKALSAMSDGDSIFFRAGDRFVLSAPLQVTRSGSADGYVVLGAYTMNGGTVSHRVSTDRPILDGDKKAPRLKDYLGLVHITGRYVEVRDLVLTNSGGLGLRFHETSDGRVDNVKTDWTYYQGIQAFKSDNIRIKDCDVTGFGHGGKYYGESVYPNGVSVRSSSNVIVQGCVVHEGWGEGINSYYGSRNVTIENNVVYATRNVGIYVDSTQNADIRGNVVLGTADSLYHRYSDKPWMGPGIALNNESYQFSGSLSTSAVAKNVRIYNNLVAGTVMGLAFWGEHSATDWRDIVVANNTFVDNETQIWLMSTKYSSVQIVNNIFLSLSSSTTDWGGAIDRSGIEWRNNYWSQGKPGAAASAGDVYQGLKLRKMDGWTNIRSRNDVSWQDFAPMSGSTTIGAGVDTILSVVATDFSGKSRPRPPDIGALQAGDVRAERRPKAPGGLSSRILQQ